MLLFGWIILMFSLWAQWGFWPMMSCLGLSLIALDFLVE